MTGWRLGFAIGNEEILEGLGQVKANIDSGAFNAVQEAGIAALESDQSCVAAMQKIYQERRDVLIADCKASASIRLRRRRRSTSGARRPRAWAPPLSPRFCLRNAGS
jgi:aspartate/methionine/tyrosine aminotransferase